MIPLKNPIFQRLYEAINTLLLRNGITKVHFGKNARKFGENICFFPVIAPT